MVGTSMSLRSAACGILGMIRRVSNLGTVIGVPVPVGPGRLFLNERFSSPSPPVYSTITGAQSPRCRDAYAMMHLIANLGISARHWYTHGDCVYE